MADTPDTPDAPATPSDAKPAPRRRASPRKTTSTDALTPRAIATRARKVVAQAEGAAGKAVTATKDAVTDTAGAAVAAVKPRSSTRGAARATKAAPAKRAATKKNDGKTGGRKSAGKTTGGSWGVAAIAGGVVAAGAAAAALLTLRGSSGKGLGTEKKPIDVSGSGDKGKGHPQSVHGGGAHQPDGTDSSASFRAGIADENTVPDKR